MESEIEIHFIDNTKETIYFENDKSCLGFSHHLVNNEVSNYKFDDYNYRYYFRDKIKYIDIHLSETLKGE